MLFQICKTFFLLLNTKEDIWKNAGKQMVWVTAGFHSSKKQKHWDISLNIFRLYLSYKANQKHKCKSFTENERERKKERKKEHLEWHKDESNYDRIKILGDLSVEFFS